MITVQFFDYMQIALNLRNVKEIVKKTIHII